ncbi:uncharacterized protein LOC142182174 [Nicotiana tabacum]|uniref:Uncharacterized protein LOC142182174 n=1 Tax=Nicotiana tabacum TaxID=4097 RepID=A0AC58US14_TOBAC
MRFGKKGKLSPRFIGPYEIIEKKGNVAYELALPVELSSVRPVIHVSMLRKYIHESHIIATDTIKIKERLTYEEITEFFQSWQIKRNTSTPYHPVGNGQAESTNKIIINNLKKRLQEAKGNLPEVLPGVLWAYRITAKTSTGETPSSLVYGAEALIPVEIGEPSTRFMQATEESNSE